MARPFSPKVLTANRLLEGDVVYLGPDRTWVQSHADALLFTEESEANAALEAAKTMPDLLVGPYLADATMQNGTPTPTHFREAFRDRGPSNYAHGKQAES